MRAYWKWMDLYESTVNVIYPVWFTGIPSVTVPVPSYSVNTGSSVTIECTYSANPQATLVRWEKTSSGNTVQIGDTAASNKYGGSTLSSPSLIIYNAAESDEGNYRCKVSNAVGTGISAQSAALDVIGSKYLEKIPVWMVWLNMCIIDDAIVKG